MGPYKYMDKVRGGEGYTSTCMRCAVCVCWLWPGVRCGLVCAWCVRGGVARCVVMAISVNVCSRRIASASEVRSWGSGAVEGVGGVGGPWSWRCEWSMELEV